MTSAVETNTRFARGPLARLAAAVVGAAVVATMGVACSGCPGLTGTAEEVPVELEWPDASPLGPVQAIDPASAPPPPVETKVRQVGAGDGNAERPEANDGNAERSEGDAASATSATPD